MRAIRRALRQWKGELGAFWGRFNTFYRIVLGILLAMAIVYGARRFLLDERRTAVAELHKELADESVPGAVPTPEEDDDIQEAEMTRENLKASLERERADTRAVIEERGTGGRADALDTIETLGRLIGRHGLIVKSAARVDCEGEFPLPRICQSYELVGGFAGIHGFLREVDQLEAPCRLHRVAVALPTETDAPVRAGQSAPLTLSFHFESIYTE
jgi:hypothetical protein